MALTAEHTVAKPEKSENGTQVKASLYKQFDDIGTWSDMYDECDSESKKMILSRLIQPVKVKRDYEIEIEFAIDFHQLGVVFDSPE